MVFRFKQPKLRPYEEKQITKINIKPKNLSYSQCC